MHVRVFLSNGNMPDTHSSASSSSSSSVLSLQLKNNTKIDFVKNLTRNFCEDRNLRSPTLIERESSQAKKMLNHRNYHDENPHHYDHLSHPDGASSQTSPSHENKKKQQQIPNENEGKLTVSSGDMLPATIGVSKSVSCTAEWCLATSQPPSPNETSDKNLKNDTKMMLSNSSASLLKAKNYLHKYCQTNNSNHQNPDHHHHHRKPHYRFHHPRQSDDIANNGKRSSQQQQNIEIEPKREHWDKKIEFLLAVIGFAVDLGNVWRFPYVCYRNGGGAFLVAYCTMLLFGGLPLFYLELALGQYFSSGCLTIWKRLCPIMKGIGYAICIIDVYMGMYYNTIIAWSLYYLYASFASLADFTLPWQDCNHSWNTDRCKTLEMRGALSSNVSSTATENGSTNVDAITAFISPAEEYYLNHVLQINTSPGIESLGSIRPSLAVCLMLVFLVVYFSLWKGVKSTGKAVWVTALMPYVVIFVFIIRATTLDGAADGIRYYLEPKWNKLLSVNVWVDAATQIFFSLGPGFGTLMALSSYNKFHNNCYKDAILTSSVNCLTSFVAGFVTFSILGFMSKKLNKDISTVVPDGPGLVFIVYPEAIATMYGSVFFSILFFVMLITLGLDSTFGGLEAMITGLCDNYPHVLRRYREIFVALLIMVIYLCALPTTTHGGNYLINLLDQYGTATPVLFVVFIETIAICWFYGSEKFSNQIKEMLGQKPGIFWRVCWRLISPFFLGFISIASLIDQKPLTLGDYEYPPWSVVLGWIITLSSLSCIPLYALYHFCRTPGDNFSDRIANCIRPIAIPAPLDKSDRKMVTKCFASESGCRANRRHSIAATALTTEPSVRSNLLINVNLAETNLSETKDIHYSTATTTTINDETRNDAAIIGDAV